jgi:hypothetical protein
MSFSKVEYEKIEDSKILKTIPQYFAFLGKEHKCKGVFKLLKRLDKCPIANSDYEEK